MSLNKQKVIVVGLPKTGTSTLAAMLGMLGYRVSGPDIHYKFGNHTYLDQQFELYDAFQDYPWCFEWQRYFDNPSAKFIVLKRDQSSWWNSFYESYGEKRDRYLSYPYFKILKEPQNKSEFLKFFETYYSFIDGYSQKYPKRFLNIDIKTFEWSELCSFLGEPIPTNMFGQSAKKPHVNKLNAQTKKTVKFIIMKKLKKILLLVLGEERYIKTVVFFRKNGIV